MKHLKEAIPEMESIIRSVLLLQVNVTKNAAEKMKACAPIIDSKVVQ